MNKMKRACKKEKGLKARILREEFLQELKNPTPPPKPGPPLRNVAGIPTNTDAADILAKIRARARSETIQPYRPKKKISPYNAGTGGMMGRLRKWLG